MIVIGTAGHIDHGKSAIVKRITGTDPDRLPEEKARGMTIDLGFAFHETQSNKSLAFVDVPGHERFVRTMIAGAGGVDAVMLVIAADDGWMPQSQEHFQVVRLLGISSGIIVINKCDLVDAEWLEMLEVDIRQKVTGSFLAEAPIVRVSALTGAGFDELMISLDKLAKQLQARKDIGKARLYVDRTFVRPGIGGVVTGTLRGGSLAVGQAVTVWPSGATGKIRSLHSANNEVAEVQPGQRTAVSFTGIDKSELTRGSCVLPQQSTEYHRQHPVLALSLELVSEAPVTLEDRRRALLIVGTSEVEGELRLYERPAMTPGEKGTVFFQPDKPIYCLVGDHFIARLPSPMVTLGGGRVLDHLEHFPRRKDFSRYNYLNERLSLTREELVASELIKQLLVPRAELLRWADLSGGAIRGMVEKLIESGKLATFQDHIYDVNHIEQVCVRLLDRVNKFLADQPHIKGLMPEQLYSLLDLDQEVMSVLLNYMVANTRLSRVDETYNPVGRGMSLKGPVLKAYNEIMNELKRDPLAPPTLPSLASAGKDAREAIRYILDTGEGHKCGSDFVFLKQTWDDVLVYVREQLQSAGELKVGDLRDKFGFTRKFVIPILEETDRLKLTTREGDRRIKGDRLES